MDLELIKSCKSQNFCKKKLLHFPNTSHSDSKSIFFAFLKLQCGEPCLSEGLTTFITPLSSSAKYIHPPLSLYLSFPRPVPLTDIFSCWVKQPNEHSLTEKEKARCFSHGKLKPSWIPGLTCNDPNHSRHLLGSAHAADYLIWVENTWMHAQQCQITSPAMINNNKKKQQYWIGSLFN